jgi:hypothetical protein
MSENVDRSGERLAQYSIPTEQTISPNPNERHDYGSSTETVPSTQE